MQCEKQDNVEYHVHQHFAQVIKEDIKPVRKTNPFICENGQSPIPESNSQRDDDDQTFSFLGQQQELLSPALSASTACELSYDNTVDLATRIFYATCHKFALSAQQVPKYSFRQSLLLHSMYSKSQQILLGMEDIKPTVILSGDDFMFTPPVQAVQSSLSDWALDLEDDSFLDGYALPQNDDYGNILEEDGVPGHAHSANNPFTHVHEPNSTGVAIPGNVFEAFIPINRAQTILTDDQSDSKYSEEDVTANDIKDNRAASAKEISNWFTASTVDRMAHANCNADAECDEDDDMDSSNNIEISSEEESDGDDSNSQRSHSQESDTCEPEINAERLQEDKCQEAELLNSLTQLEQSYIQDETSVEKDSGTISASPEGGVAEPEPLLKIMRELEGYSTAITLTTPDGSSSLDVVSVDTSERMAGPKEFHQGIRSYISTLQTLVHQKLIDSNASQTVTANGKRVKPNLGFFKKWLSWLSSVVKVWKLFFVIAESLLVSFGDAVLQRIIVHTLGRQLESLPAIVTA
ncbi:hypothetical protein BGW37DRAFT_507935 [Umbelopsis sp. PMI_123]|nr:hypothetical protein BGW37DRAFT_507935 [Umbelopsis sp. PMI_123]